MKLICIFFFLICAFFVSAQQPEVTQDHEQQLEQSVSNPEGLEQNDDSYASLTEEFQKRKLDLNSADAEDLADLLLNEMQIRSLIDHRNIFGPLINVMELQAVSGWDINTIQRLLPYIIVSDKFDLNKNFRDRLLNGEHKISTAVSVPLGGANNQLPAEADSLNGFEGSPLKLTIRYKYSYSRLLQYGVLAEKDAGESFFKGSHRTGFDFYSFHFFARNVGKIKLLALGDFIVNMGQGLIQWQGMSFRKGPDITCIKHQSPVIKPYQAAGEYFFYRGIGIGFSIKRVSMTIFGSYRKLDATLSIDSSGIDPKYFMSSLQTSGYHRSASEIQKSGIMAQAVVGSNISFNVKRVHVGVNMVHFINEFPLNKTHAVYDLVSGFGKSCGNISLDYSYSLRNFHFFGELAADYHLNTAFISGLLVSVARRADLSFLYRNFSPRYQSMYVNVFAENYRPVNERGFFSGFSIRPTDRWQLSGYLDLFSFPWLRYRINAPTSGSDKMLRLLFRPRKSLELYALYQHQNKLLNTDYELVMSYPAPVANSRFRLHINFNLGSGFSIRARTEFLRYYEMSQSLAGGYLIFTELFYKPMQKSFSGSFRIQYYQSNSYESRIYAYENDLPGNFSVPSFSGKGYRYYINVKYVPFPNCTLWCRFASTINADVNSSNSSDFKLMFSIRI